MDLRYLGNENILTVTPYRDQHGRRILIYRYGLWRPNRVTIDDIFRATIILQELGSLEPISQIVGGVGIFDLKDLSLEHILQLSPSVAQKMIALLVVCKEIILVKFVYRLSFALADFDASTYGCPAYC